MLQEIRVCVLIQITSTLKIGKNQDLKVSEPLPNILMWPNNQKENKTPEYRWALAWLQSDAAWRAGADGLLSKPFFPFYLCFEYRLS